LTVIRFSHAVTHTMIPIPISTAASLPGRSSSQNEIAQSGAM
jgi:hypothetical protein